MKKLFAILLVLAMLIPMGTVAQAAESGDKPFYLIQWGNFTSELENVYRMPFMWVDKSRLDTPLNCIPYGGDYTPEANAQWLKDCFEGYPDGARHVNFCLAQTAFRGLAEDVVFVEKGVEAVQTYLHAFLPAYKAIGGQLDGMVLDIEFEDLYANYIESRYYVTDPLVYDRIVNNPAYKEKIRPELEARGFKFYPNPNEYTPEIYGIHSAAGSEYSMCRSIWDSVLRSYVNQSLTEAFKEVWDYYPECEINDYQSKTVRPWVESTGEYGGIEGGGGVIETAGNSSNENYYSVRPYSFFKPGTYPNPKGYTNAVYENKPFNYFQFDVNIFRGTYLGADDNRMSQWIAHYFYNVETKESVSMTPYYAESLYHLFMLNPPAIMGYIIQSEINDDGLYEFALQLVNEVLKELNKYCSNADREPINVRPNWNTHYVLSGMRVADKNIWRITPDVDVISREDFKVEGTDPTFRVNGQTVTFPQGKILEEGNIPGLEKETYNDLENQTYGYWVETPAGVNPVETKAENYFVEYPAYGEDYDSFDVGMEYNYKNALPADCWEVKKTGKSSATVIANPADANDKVLELKGTYTLRLVNMPQNITAAKSYAENQAWQVSVTVPADMGAEAEVILLNAGNEKKKTNDGGFKIAGGKVYYSDNGEYKEMTGVTLTAGSEYTFKREMDFNNAEEMKSSYYVYDNAGNLVGKAKNAIVDSIDLPVHNVTMSCSKVDAGAVLVDDFKLYPSKVGYDFTLYDAKHGMKITDQETPSAVDTAYNFSWLNATGVEKSYSVVAQYYNGDTMASEEVVKEVKMAPYSDGVEFGVVELGDKGKAVKIFIKDNNPAEEEDDTTGTGDNTGDDNTGKTDGFVLDTKMIIIIAAAVVLIAVIVIVIVVSSKKKAAKKAAATIEEAPAEEAPAVEEATETEETPAEETPETDEE